MQLSGVSVVLEGVMFVVNTAACANAECAGYEGSIATGGGAAIVIEAPNITDVSITLSHCRLFGNAEVVSPCNKKLIAFFDGLFSVT